ncbi:hypothetical protein P3S68_002093 [Capsicum galapagoense]
MSLGSEQFPEVASHEQDCTNLQESINRTNQITKKEKSLTSLHCTCSFIINLTHALAYPYTDEQFLSPLSDKFPENPKHNLGNEKVEIRFCVTLHQPFSRLQFPWKLKPFVQSDWM